MTSNLDNKSKKKNGYFLKLLLILILITVITWSSIKLVNIAPAAFSSLASIANNLLKEKAEIYNSEIPEEINFTVSNSQNSITTGGVVELTWDEITQSGSFTFLYPCVEGVALTIKTDDEDKNIDCESTYNIGNTTSLTLIATSEKNHLVNVVYTIDFFGITGNEPRFSDTGEFTITNDRLSADTDSDTETDNTPEVAITESPTVPNTNTVTKPAPTDEPQYIYTIPVSDPDGRIDLGTRFLASGRIINDTFFAGEIKQNEPGAIQFEVKNYGTKTSNRWTFSITLPTGETYQSPTQTPLKPNERAVLAVSFDSGKKASHNFVVRVKDSEDATSLNNQFVTIVNFVR